jgi:zinc/manganese transport system substrate-binding protein
MDWLTDPFAPVFMQRALLELALLSVAAGALGAFVVLRRLAFSTHALGVGAFPGAVVAYGIGVSAFLGGLVSSLVIAGGLALLARRRDLDTPAATGLLLAGALALGSLLVSDVFTQDARVDTLLFGSLLGVGDGDVVRSAAVVGGVALVALVLGRTWFVTAFDPESARVLGVRPLVADLSLTAALAVTAVATVDAVGSLLVAALFVVPAATVRLVTRRLPTLVAGSAALALAVSVVGLWIAYKLDAPPGATVALCAAVSFATVFAARELATPRRVRSLLVGAAASAVVAGLAAPAAFAAPSAAGQAAADGRLRVVATTPIVADWVRAVGGNDVDVRALLKPLVDPHDYEPGTSDAAAVAAAKLVVSSGGGFDEWADGLVETAGSATLVELAPLKRLKPPALDDDHGHEADGHTEDEHDHGDLDPHYWHDPTLAAAAVNALRDALVKADPARASAYRSRARAYVAALTRLDRDLKAAIAAVPKARRLMVTDHDAFGYLARRYGITVVGAAIPSTSSAAQANAKDTAALIDEIKERKVATLFSESSIDPKLIRQIASEAGAKVESGLYGDTLGKAGSGAAGYIAMMRHNMKLLVAGMRGRST